jgi:hypothetical protein
MKKKFCCVVVFLLTLTSSLGQSANAAPKKYKNCTEMNQVHPGGVAKPGAVNKGGKTKNEPTIDAPMYKLNASLDRDKDGIACEK